MRGFKKAMTEAPVLAMPNYSKPFDIEDDVACDKGIEAVLTQVGKPITYISKTIIQKNHGLSTYEEFLAILMAVSK